jgi:hypothetical protein
VVEKVAHAGSMSNPAAILLDARAATEAAKIATLVRLDTLEKEKDDYLAAYATEKAAIKEALRTREYKKRATKP